MTAEYLFVPFTYCPKCGQLILSGTNQCPKCGMKLEPIEFYL